MGEFDSCLEFIIFLYVCFQVIKFSFFVNYETIKKTTDKFLICLFANNELYFFCPENQLNSFHIQLLHRSKILIDDQL